MEDLKELLENRLTQIRLEGFDSVTAHGFTQMPNVILKNKALSPGAKVVYACLLSYAWGKESCFPGQDALAADMGVSARHVRRFLDELKNEGYLESQRRGLGRTNLYVLRARVKRKKVHK